MKRANWIAVVAVFALILTAAQASAAPITYSWWGYGSGFLGNDSFTNALVRFNYYADTDDTVFLDLGVRYNEAGTGTVTIDGIGSATFIDDDMAALWTTDTGYILLGYLDASEFAIGVSGYVLPSWDFLSAVGPETGRSFSDDGRYATTAGDFYWFPPPPIDPGFTFQATTGGQAVPDPGSSLLLLSMGLAGLTAFRRWRG